MNYDKAFQNQMQNQLSINKIAIEQTASLVKSTPTVPQYLSRDLPATNMQVVKRVMNSCGSQLSLSELNIGPFSHDHSTNA